MPTYEYRCDACEHNFEIEQRITADRLKKCPKCKKLKLTRLIGTGNFILKGGGWYADLYSSTPKKKDKKAEKESSSSDSSDSSSSSDSSDSSESSPSSDSKPKKEKKKKKASSD